MSYIRDFTVYQVPPKYSQWPSHGIRVNILRPRQNGRHFADDIFKWILVNENAWIVIEIPLKFVPRYTIYNSSALVETMALRRPDDKPLSQPMLAYVIEAYMHRSASMGWLAWWAVFTHPDSKVHGANMGPTRVLSAPDGPHVSPMHDDVIKWKHFPHYRPFVRVIHQSLVNSRTKASDADSLIEVN